VRDKRLAHAGKEEGTFCFGRTAPNLDLIGTEPKGDGKIGKLVRAGGQERNPQGESERPSMLRDSFLRKQYLKY
jgi:hypothetical protein